ncbi:MAG TPA: M23 family metallopeptidase [Pyrinomonadaceae bacterium]|jgi:murein DD-endopeptidase MepM/ murein hydrolase activator NlpD
MRAVKLRILLCVVFLVIVSLVWLAISYRTTPLLPAIDLPARNPIAIGTPLPPDPTPTPEPSSFVGRLNLIVPVAGVPPDQLTDTFDDARSEGRVHDAIDIPAAAETPVLAAADGKILKLFHSERGGTTIYQLSASQELVFYYAHLSRYADGLAEGSLVKQGEVIAYVGDTGNAGAGNYHLHFSIAVVSDPKRYWEGTNINPYPLLHHRTQ